MQDSMPRAALLSIHARLEGAHPTTWKDPSLAQVWGPRFSAYVVAERDVPIFSLGRFPEDPKGRRAAEDLAARLQRFLGDRSLPYGEAGRGLREHPNRLRYAATTGTVRIRWEGARQPTIWCVPRPDVNPADARLELARRYLHVFGPTTPASFVKWAGIAARAGAAAFAALGTSLTRVQTPLGDAWILARDEPGFRNGQSSPPAVRLLPSGDPYFLLQGTDRELLVPDARRRGELWTPRVWPGALLVDGEVIGTWRRTQATVSLEPWRRLSRPNKDAVEAETRSLPLPVIAQDIAVRWKA